MLTKKCDFYWRNSTLRNVFVNIVLGGGGEASKKWHELDDFFLSPRVDWILKQKNPVFFAQKNARRIFLGMDVVQYAFYSLKTSNSCSASTHRPHACRYVTKKPCFRRFKIVKRREHKMFHFLMNLYTKRTTDFLGMDVVEYAFYYLETSNSCSASTHRPHACRYVTKKTCFRWFKILKRREHKMFHFLMNVYTNKIPSNITVKQSGKHRQSASSKMLTYTKRLHSHVKRR